MKLSRRDLVRVGATGVLLAGVEGVARAANTATLVIYDSRRAESRAFALAQGARGVDVAREQAGRWATMRAALPKGGIVGLTRWSDHVIAAGYAAEQGWRLAHIERRGGLIYWEMA